MQVSAPFCAPYPSWAVSFLTLAFLSICKLPVGGKPLWKNRKNVEQNQALTKLFHRTVFLPFHKPTRGAWRQKRGVLRGNLCKTKSKSTTFPQVLKSMWKTLFAMWKNSNFFFEFVDLSQERGILQHLKFYQAVRRNNGGVVAPENFCNTREGHFGQFAN